MVTAQQSCSTEMVNCYCNAMGVGGGGGGERCFKFQKKYYESAQFNEGMGGCQISRKKSIR